MAQSNVLPGKTSLEVDDDGWAEAGRVAASMGPIFPPIAGYVRILNTPIGNDLRIKATKDRVLADCLQTPTIREGLVQLIDNFYPKRLPVHRELTPGDLTALVDYETCAALIALLYLFRRTKGALASHSRWQVLSELVHERADVGYYLGLSLPEFGGALGLLVGGMRFLSLGFIASRNPDRYAEYEEHLSERGISFDVEYEFKTWGFSHPQFAVMYLQRMGFGRNVPFSIAMGLSPQVGRISHGTLSAKIRAVSWWIESIVRPTKGASPITKCPFSMSAQETEQLLTSVKTQMQSQVGIFWLEPR